MGGLLMAFQDFMPIKGLFGSRFVGLKNFERLFKLPTFWRVLRNTVVGLGTKMDGVVREDHFVITVASEIMAVLVPCRGYEGSEGKTRKNGGCLQLSGRAGSGR